MDTKQKPKIEAIYPLTTMQQGLLFHHLMNKEDQGFLHVSCALKGALNEKYFKDAWQKVVLRHPILRTSVHWKNIQNPLQVVRPDGQMCFTLLDWSELTDEEQKNALIALDREKNDTGVDFEKGPLSQISLIKLGHENHCLLWCCHHLLLDGWSSSTILQEVFETYNGLVNSSLVSLETIPSYKTYLNWLQKLDKQAAIDFWSSTFETFESPSLFATSLNASAGTYKQQHLKLSEEASNHLKLLAKQCHVTTNSLFQGIWALLLAKYFGINDTCFGTTVSGRSATFPNIELMTGMFMNVLPVRSTYENSENLKEYFEKLQSQQQQARNYEHFSLEEITSWTNHSEGVPLFDSLFVFENFPWKDMHSGGIHVSDFKSGLTTTYPVTLIIKTGTYFDLNLITNSEIISSKTIAWLLENLELILTNSSLQTHTIIGDLLGTLGTQELEKEFISAKQPILEAPKLQYTPPKNKVELELTEIWEIVFGRHSISVHDNFFELGGKSIIAIKLFAKIEEKMGVKLPPTTLLENPTIATLASILNKDGEVISWKYLVPIRAKGSKAPLFCIHAGGGHVFFYNQLTNYIDQDRPVYALQPSGVYDGKQMHTSIEQMAIDYAEEIRAIQPEGIYNVMVYCFSTAVGLEMASYLKKIDKEINLIVMDTMAEQEHLLTKTRIKMRISGLVKRLTSNPFKAVRNMFMERVDRYVKPIWIHMVGSEEEKNIEKMRAHLVHLYNQYLWKTVDAGVTLIMTKKQNNRMNIELVDSWKKIVEYEVTEMYINGDHRTLFEEPDVQYAASAIDECMQVKNKEPQ